MQHDPFPFLVINCSSHPNQFRKVRVLTPRGVGRILWAKIASRVGIVIGKLENDFMHQ